jgi:ribosomal protein S18 acetylase RimI-like enzyme
MQSGLRTRKAAIADIPFLATIDYEASLPPLNHCFWEDILEGTDTNIRSFVEAMFRADASNWGNVSDFLVLEESGKPIAAAAGYTPSAENYSPLHLSLLDKIAADLHWPQEITGRFRDHYIDLWGEDLRPFYLTPQSPWIIETVAVLPEARGRGLGKALLQAMLTEGRSQGHTHAGIMVINGNDIARRMYESVGFKPYQTFHADYFLDQFKVEFSGITKFGICLD